MKPSPRLPLIALSALLLTACAAPQAPLPDQNWFRLAADGVTQPGPELVAGLLMVEEPRSDGLHAERALSYSDDPGHRRINQYHYDYWADPPTRLVQSYLVKRLRAAGVASEVMHYDINQRADATIGGRVERFTQLIDAEHSQVVVELELQLNYPDESRPRLLRDYSAQVSVTGSTPEATITGYEQALNDIIARFLNDAHGVTGSAR